MLQFINDNEHEESLHDLAEAPLYDSEVRVLWPLNIAV